MNGQFHLDQKNYAALAEAVGKTPGTTNLFQAKMPVTNARRPQTTYGQEG